MPHIRTTKNVGKVGNKDFNLCQFGSRTTNSQSSHGSWWLALDFTRTRLDNGNMFHSPEAEASRKPRRLRKRQTPTPPIEVVKTFAYKVSASFRRKTASVKERYRHALDHLETNFLNSSQGDAGLIYAVHNIPSNITAAELASAFNDTIARLCSDSQEVQISSSSLSLDSSYRKDILDDELERFPPSSRPSQTTPPHELLLPELSESFTTLDSQSTAQASIDDLLFRHGLDELLQAPLIPTTRQSPNIKAADPPLCPKQPPVDSLDFLRFLAFDDLHPYPRWTKALAPVNRAIVGIFERDDKKIIVRKQGGNDLRKASTDNPSQPFLPKPHPLSEPKTVAKPKPVPQALRPGPLKIRKAAQPRQAPWPLPVKTYMPSEAPQSHARYVAYQPHRAHLLPVARRTSITLMEEMTEELDKVFGAFDSTTKGAGNQEEATSQSQRPEALFTTTPPIVPPRNPSRRPRNASETTTARPLSFKDRLLDASRSAIQAAADEAGTSELRWFHCGT